MVLTTPRARLHAVALLFAAVGLSAVLSLLREHSLSSGLLALPVSLALFLHWPLGRHVAVALLVAGVVASLAFGLFILLNASHMEFRSSYGRSQPVAIAAVVVLVVASVAACLWSIKVLRSASVVALFGSPSAAA